MPQLDLVSYMSQFFWLWFFFLGFYLALVQHFLPKMARILKFRHKKMASIQDQSSGYQEAIQAQEANRWNKYSSFLDIQKKLSEAGLERKKEIEEEFWQNKVSSISSDNLQKAFTSDNDFFRKHMLNQNISLSYLNFIKEKNRLVSENMMVHYILKK
uniref:ATP synthase F0 subunit 8 n=1 Tax=Tetraselmis sp. CCMP 881 TaxID=1812852 RepID=A0A650ARN3_9CHLO|nr:ATP synthase F0 subunit 8 [Tetraselmis sp. CCMP 881]